MIWHDIRDPQDPELDRLAAQYGLHPLHIEDCRHRNQSAKVEQQNGYLFVVLKPVDMDAEFALDAGDLDLFVHPDYIITVHEHDCRTMPDLIERVRALPNSDRSDMVLYRLLDGVIDSYLPVLDRISDHIDEIEDTVIEQPDPPMLQSIFVLKRALIELRRVLTNTRDVVGHLQRTPVECIRADLQPFLRDVYDHVARNLDLVEMQRDLLSGSMDIYLSSVSNRMNRVMKVLTVVSTISLPAIVIAGIYGMNVHNLPWSEHPHGGAIVSGLIMGTSVALLIVMRLLHWL
jgi:magnesium transporter